MVSTDVIPWCSTCGMSRTMMIQMYEEMYRGVSGNWTHVLCPRCATPINDELRGGVGENKIPSKQRLLG